MAEKTKWIYEKLDENGKIKSCPVNDPSGKVTGHIVFGVKAWFDENPEERKRLGWIKKILHSPKEIEYNRRTQYLVKSNRQIDEWTVEEEYHVMDKSEEMMRLQELMAEDTIFFGGDEYAYDNGTYEAGVDF